MSYQADHLAWQQRVMVELNSASKWVDALSQVPRTHELLPEVEGLALQARRHLQVRPAPAHS